MNSSNNSDPHSLSTFLSLIYIACTKLELSPETRHSSLWIFKRFWLERVADDKEEEVGKGKNSTASTVASSSIEAQGPPRDPGCAAAASIFLACKAEEQFRRLRDVVNVCHRLGIYCIQQVIE